MNCAIYAARLPLLLLPPDVSHLKHDPHNRCTKTPEPQTSQKTGNTKEPPTQRHRLTWDTFYFKLLFRLGSFFHFSTPPPLAFLLRNFFFATTTSENRGSYDRFLHFTAYSAAHTLTGLCWTSVFRTHAYSLLLLVACFFTFFFYFLF